jgi:hydroxymethylbilane synthase
MPFDFNEIKFRRATPRNTSEVSDSHKGGVHVEIHPHEKKTKIPPLTLRLGTRKSPLALAQADEVKQRLEQVAHFPLTVEIVPFETSGDKFLHSTLQDIGGKGLFTKEIEQALQQRQIDIAVHSMKDVPTARQSGLELITVLPREDVRDCFISLDYKNIQELPQGAIVGTASLRRKAQLLNMRADLQIEVLRGNVQTRLRKLQEKPYHATLLAMAGLNRLGLYEYTHHPLSVTEFPPAPAQGIIGIENHVEMRSEFKALLQKIHCPHTMTEMQAERAFLKMLDGNCRTPIAALARLTDGKLHFYGHLLADDGQKIWSATKTVLPEQALEVGMALGQYVKLKAGMK